MKDYANLIARQCWPLVVSDDQQSNIELAHERVRCARLLRDQYTPQRLEEIWRDQCQPKEETADA